MGILKPGDHGSTYGGNPLGAATARAALKVMVQERLVERSRKMGDYFMKKLRTIKNSHIIEVRGKGLWIGIQLDTKARPYCEALAREGILCKDTHDNVIRVAPPLIITKKEIDWAFKRIAKVLAE